MSDIGTSQLHAGISAYEEQNYERAYNLLRPLAEAGNPQAQCYVASMYHLGLGVRLDGTIAVKWYLKAALQEERTERISAVAYNNLATIYSVGMPGVPRNPELAEECRQKASALGFEM